VAIRVSLLVVYVCTSALVVRAQSLDQSVVRVLLAFDSESGVPGAIRSNAVNEAARLWAPYGIVVREDDATACDTFTHLRVVAVQDRRNPRDNELGSVRFSLEGVPDSTLAIDYTAIARLAITARPFGLDASAWPLRLRDDVVGRATGRALAHEIGHYVLRSPHHASSGLMRSTLRASTLTQPKHNGLDLMPSDVARLQIVLTAGVLQHRSLPSAGDAGPPQLTGCLALAR